VSRRRKREQAKGSENGEGSKKRMCGTKEAIKGRF
jgi:hypothetical protein